MNKLGFRILIIILIICTCLTGYLAWQDSRRAVVVIDWTTASEIDTVGFNIYRSEQRDQDFTRINEGIIPASQEPFTGGEYSFQDYDVRLGRVYYYLLEDVSMDGLVSQNGPIEVKAQANYGLNLLQSMAFGLCVVIMIINKNRLLNISMERGNRITTDISS